VADAVGGNLDQVLEAGDAASLGRVSIGYVAR
jgi:hypothetical protein